MGTGDLTILLAGDALITRPWSQLRDPAFLALVEEIRGADVAIANLETVIHEFKGFAQHDSGGLHMASPPAIAEELRWAGFDMLAHANNHTFDYGSDGVLETLDHVEKAGLLLAGSGRDLQAARAPRYFRCDDRTIALVSMASTFVPYGAASRARPDMPGRPGLNPLRLTSRERAIVVPPPAAGWLRAAGRMLGRKPHKLADRSFKVGLRFHVGKKLGVERASEDLAADRDANMRAIAEAARNADIVIASIHAHRQGRWLREFAEDAIEEGADVVFIHGPHEVRAIGFHRGKPIFFSMGDFVFETDYIERFPAAAYESLDLGDDASPANLIQAGWRRKLPVEMRRSMFEVVAASLSFAGGRISRIRLIPVDLQFQAPEGRHGRPQLAAPDLGRRIVESVAALSRPHGVRVSYDPAGNRGEVEIPGR